MKRKIFTSLFFIICCLSTYAQDSIFTAKAYYSIPNEITVEIENLADQEMVLLVEWGSHVKFYTKAEEYKTEKLKSSDLETTDSMRVLARIPPHKIHISRYVVKENTLTKAYLFTKYSLNFASPPVKNPWDTHSQELDILPYNAQRKPIEKKRIADRKERISGEYVFSNPETMPEFPGGKVKLIYFLNHETEEYTEHNGDYGVVRVKFIIEKDGSISHPYLIVSNTYYKDTVYFPKATLEILERMPKWNPGLNKGKPVRSFYTLTVMFKLNHLPPKTR